MDEKIYEILEIIKITTNLEELHNKLSHYHENDIANVFEYLNDEQIKKLYKIFDQQELSDIFSYLEDPTKYIDALNNEQAADLIELMDVDDAIEVLEELGEEKREEIIELMDEEVVSDIELIKSYEEFEIGSYMTNNYITISKTDTIKQAMKKVIDGASNNDNFTILYVLNEDDTLYGTIELKDLIKARSTDELESIIKMNYPVVLDKEEISVASNKIKEYEIDSTAVVDENNVFLGVITLADLIEVVDDTLSEDYAKLAGLSSEEELEESTFKSVKLRIPWLCALLVLGLIISIVMKGFETVVIAVPVIVFFQSMILGMGGNVGTQSLAVTIRTISDDNITTKEVFRLIFKELRIAFFNGLLTSVISFIVVVVYLYISHTIVNDAVGFNFIDICKVGVVVSISLLISMVISGLIGTIIPILLQKIKIDPAVASGPFITSINDITAIVIYYGIAIIVFNSIM